MKKAPSVVDLAKELTRVIGERRARAILKSLAAESGGDTLTIVANKSLHTIPKRYLRGHVYIASRGNLDLSSARAAKATYLMILKRLGNVLMKQNWRYIYLIPTGHPTLSVAIKLAVYQITRRNTTDVFYANGKYFDLNISVRNDER